LENHRATVGFNHDRLSDIFDRVDPIGFKSGGVSVTTELPVDLKLSEIVGIRHYHEEQLSKVSYRRGNWLYLCVFKTKDFAPYVTSFLFEIKSRNDWSERYEDWEIVGDPRPFKKVSRILRSRCVNAEELHEWELFYGEKNEL